MYNHQDNLWSLAALKYFRLIEPEIIKKILNGFLPVRANKPYAFLLSRISESPEQLLFITGIIRRSVLLCQAKHHIVLSGDTFLHSVSAQAPRENLARIKQKS